MFDIIADYLGEILLLIGIAVLRLLGHGDTADKLEKKRRKKKRKLEKKVQKESDTLQKHLDQLNKEV